mmetsp:Transcript_88749/g.177441  ORF Transcript_88749/g.177441 Transcript_88749/m.177441 type:complete len:257 (+) Transcript_88749:98-868(+)
MRSQSIDNSGQLYMAKVFAAEVLVYLPSFSYSVAAFISMEGTVTCNTSEALELVLQVQILSSLFVMVAIGPCATERITSGESYWRGLAGFHGSYLHWLLRVHIVFDLLILVYGALAVATVNPQLCSLKLPKAVSIVLYIQFVVLLYRISLHVLFPAYVAWYEGKNPLPDIPDPGRTGFERAGDGLERDETATERLGRMRKLMDTNFHAIQTAWTHREKIGNLKSTNKKVAPSPSKDDTPHATIVVRSRSPKAGSEA